MFLFIRHSRRVLRLYFSFERCGVFPSAPGFLCAFLSWTPLPFFLPGEVPPLLRDAWRDSSEFSFRSTRSSWSSRCFSMRVLRACGNRLPLLTFFLLVENFSATLAGRFFLPKTTAPPLPFLPPHPVSLQACPFRGDRPGFSLPLFPKPLFLRYPFLPSNNLFFPPQSLLSPNIPLFPQQFFPACRSSSDATVLPEIRIPSLNVMPPFFENHFGLQASFFPSAPSSVNARPLSFFPHAPFGKSFPFFPLLIGEPLVGLRVTFSGMRKFFPQRPPSEGRAHVFFPYR